MSSQQRTFWGGNRYALPSLVAAALLIAAGLAHQLFTTEQVVIANVPKISFVPNTTVGTDIVLGAHDKQGAAMLIFAAGLKALADRTAAANAH